mgnify:CR=1 FL=1
MYIYISYSVCKCLVSLLAYYYCALVTVACVHFQTDVLVLLLSSISVHLLSSHLLFTSSFHLLSSHRTFSGLSIFSLSLHHLTLSLTHSADTIVFSSHRHTAVKVKLPLFADEGAGASDVAAVDEMNMAM